MLALALVLADTYLLASFPPVIREALAPLVRAAQAVLAATDDKWTVELAKRFRIVPRGPATVGPEVQRDVLAAVTRALGERRKLIAVYRAEDGEAREYVLDPLGSVQRAMSLYLVAWRPGRQERQFLLHRFESARMTHEAAEPDDDFSLDAYLASGQLGYALSASPIAFVARFTARAARTLAELRLSRDQRLEKLSSGEVRVRATVAHTRELEGWLVAFGGSVLIEEPEKLVEACVETAKAFLERHKVTA